MSMRRNPKKHGRLLHFPHHVHFTQMDGVVARPGSLALASLACVRLLPMALSSVYLTGSAPVPPVVRAEPSPTTPPDPARRLA
jgi:hypothetical protein